MKYGQTIYFIGIALPESLNTRISQLQWQLYDDKNARMLKPLLPHVTLLHPPALKGTMPDELLPVIRQAAKPYLPLNLEVSGVQFFNGQACSLKIESLSLHSLYEKIVHSLPFEVQSAQLRRDFSPHITLAQIKQPAILDRRQLTDVIEQHVAFPFSFEVTTLTHFKRILPRVYIPKTC